MEDPPSGVLILKHLIQKEVTTMFTGFTPETVDFLWGIRLNNNREWFLANKKQYVDTLY